MSHFRNVMRNLWLLDDLDKISASIAINQALDEARWLADEDEAAWQNIIQDLESHAQRIELRQDGKESSHGRTLCRYGALRGRPKSKQGPPILHREVKTLTPAVNIWRCQDPRHNHGQDLQGEEHERSATMECFICKDDIPFPQLVGLKCRHYYCIECLGRRFEAATNDRSLYPPECCEIKISLRQHRSRLETLIVKNYEERKVEWDTKDPIYCSYVLCGKFLPSRKSSRKFVTCSKCWRQTCLKCHKRGHEEDGDSERVCDEKDDRALRATLSLMSRKHWKRCPTCHTGVEINSGCNHVRHVPPANMVQSYAKAFRCLCGTSFCYLCGSRWKSCTCKPRYAEHNSRN